MSLKNAIGAIALISGTSIGAGVLALPVDTAHLGLGLTMAYFVLCWFFMTFGALYVLEANLQVGVGTNLISMAKPTLGFAGQAITWLMYLLLLYSLTAAYLSGAGAWMATGLKAQAVDISLQQGAIAVALITSACLIVGTHSIDMVNRVLMIILASAFLSLLFIGGDEIVFSRLDFDIGQHDLTPLPLIITTFGFAIVIPTITHYLNGNPAQLSRVILLGSFIPLATYLVWDLLVVGMLPEKGVNSLLAIQAKGHPATDIPLALENVTKQHWAAVCCKAFAIIALITSILGVSLSLFDFLADGLSIEKTTKSRLLLALITFGPPLVFVYYYPRGYSQALRFAGIYVSFILGILPTLMVWRGRYHKNLSSNFQVFGGRIMMFLTLAFFIGIVSIEIRALQGANLVF